MTSFDRFIDQDVAWDGPFRMVECRKALSPSALPGIDWSLNPYGGCGHGCIYCYAPESTHVPWGEWTVVRVRKGIPGRLVRELIGLKGTIGIGTVTDPWQPAESRFLLTRSCLQRLQGRGIPVHCHTKSALIIRDIALLSNLKAEVGFTITSLDDEVSRAMEPGASLPMERMEAMKELMDAGIDTYALLGPVLDVIKGREAELVSRISDTGVRRVMLDPLRPRPLLSERLAAAGIHGSDSSLQAIREVAESLDMTVEDAF